MVWEAQENTKVAFHTQLGGTALGAQWQASKPGFGCTFPNAHQFPQAAHRAAQPRGPLHAGALGTCLSL